MKNFINNTGSGTLKTRLLELISKSKELKFLIGFFYFSGIRELYNGLKDNNKLTLKVLVGLNVDKVAFGLVECGKTEQSSDEERVHDFFESVKRSINSDEFDTQEFYEQVRFFVKLIKENRLIIRKTFRPNHAKLYLFRLDENQVKKTLFITGSSNLTRSGLTTQEEFNVEISDFGFEDTESYFDDLWDEAIKITENDKVKEKLIETVEKETHIKEITPFEAFVFVLKTYLDSFKQRPISLSLKSLLIDKGYTPYTYQLDAVKQALSIIEEYNGVIIADVVGLGKSVIASMVARELGKRGVIICPPGIMGDRNKNSGWSKYAEEFGLHDWEIRSCGDLDKVAEFMNRATDVEVVIIDEAHRFRNEDTKNYEYLKNICRGKIVMLLTATPFNNTPDDILSLLELFIIPKKSGITLENDLKFKFRTFKGIFDRLAFIKKNHNSSDPIKRKKAEGHYESLFEEKTISLTKIKVRAHYLSKQIRDVIEPVIIRRNRLDLQNDPDYREEVKHLSKIDEPQEWFYELTEDQSNFYDQILEEYFSDPEDGGRFKGAIYKPFEYEIKSIKPEKRSQEQTFQFTQQRNLYDFMRRLLVKRFESSFGSFEQSIRNFKRIAQDVLQFIDSSKGKYILDRGLLEKIYDSDIDEIEEELKKFAEKLKNGEYPKQHKIYDVNKFEKKDEFLSDIKSDLALYDEILNRLKTLDLVKDDPKAISLIDNVKRILKTKPATGEPKRKVVIFTEYVDTAKYLEKMLDKEFGERLLRVIGDLPQSKIASLDMNYDASYHEQKDDYDVLLATDKISEGFNLNRAGIVINYDIPWNPVRVIQRVGRINRISKKVFDLLYISNFFPTERGATIVKSREIAQHKMFLIHNTLGEDSKIFDVDEEPTPSKLFERIQRNPDKLEQESFYTVVKRKMQEIQKNNPEILLKTKTMPARIKVAKHFDEDLLLVFIRKGRLYVRGIVGDAADKNNIISTTLEDIYNKIICDEKEKPLPLSGAFWEKYGMVKKFKEYTTVPISEASLEQRALNNLAFLITNPWEELLPLLSFIRTLREDITDYGTLPDYTLRRIANLEKTDKEDAYKKGVIKEITLIEKELGEGYLDREKARTRDLSKEIIIAIENRKS